MADDMIDKYIVMWTVMEREESRSNYIGFTKVALGKFIDQNNEVMYFTKETCTKDNSYVQM